MELLAGLFYKCYTNDLHFATNPEAGGLVSVHDYDRGNNFVWVAEGYMNSPTIESPKDALTRMHKEVDAYLNPVEVDEEHEPEEARAKMTEYERKLKESGHVEGDFS